MRMPLRPDPSSVIQGVATVSDRIRALDRAGYSRSEIAAFLGKRYQHVRNVLVDDERRIGTQPPPSAPITDRHGMKENNAAFEPMSQSGAALRLEVGRDGQMRLPESLLQALGVSQGGGLTAWVQADGSVSLLSAAQALKRVQLMLGLPLSGASLVDELIADRRAEAEREDRDG